MSDCAILIVDDERSICEVIGEVLTEAYDVQVYIANSAAEALFELGAHDIHLILMDVMMPEVDGLTLIREIRTDPRWCDIPVLVVSALADPEDRQRALAAGANGYLPKPFGSRELERAVESHLIQPLGPRMA